jgi:hypothetical protein
VLLLIWIAQWYSADDRGSSPGRGREFFSSPPRPDRLWSPPSLLSSGYQGISLGVKRPRREADHPVPKSRKRGAIPQLPHYTFTAWCSVKAQGQLYVYLTSASFMPHFSLSPDAHASLSYLTTALISSIIWNMYFWVLFYKPLEIVSVINWDACWTDTRWILTSYCNLCFRPNISGL